MTSILVNDAITFFGTTTHDIIGDGFVDTEGAELSVAEQGAMLVNGRQGDDMIATGRGNDLAAGDMVGAEWQLVDGAWVYHKASLLVSTYGWDTSFDDTITTDAGHDVLLGNGGADLLTSGAFETFEIDVVSRGDTGALSFRAVQASDGISYNFDGSIISYATTVLIGDSTVAVDAFAAGQSNLYQVINGQLNVFNVQSGEYELVGKAPEFRINAVGFNIENSLIYGVA